MSSRAEVVIVASAFGAEQIRNDGHAVWAEIAAHSCASGFEVRRELFNDDESVSHDSLRALGRKIRDLRMWTVFSTPATLFADDGQLADATLAQAIEEANAIGARILKLPLGGTEQGIESDHATFERLSAALKQSNAKLLVENGQLKAGGKIGSFVDLFSRANEERVPLTMTFDTGNWVWADQDPLEAARQLAPHVSYVHCKAVQGSGARMFAAPPAREDAGFVALLSVFSRQLPRGVEFPFNPSARRADANHYVKWLAEV
ncbi:TIM barrel protein [Paraburkholderia nemoris]|uniref:sugar phosphate isomerase/epimerase family protein n=1 Tax=Paraburkholderia nemoris TaxID=2793076 RepID=UPI0038BB4E09